jgi:hypothetical protein
LQYRPVPDAAIDIALASTSITDFIYYAVDQPMVESCRCTSNLARCSVVAPRPASDALENRCMSRITNLAPSTSTPPTTPTPFAGLIRMPGQYLCPDGVVFDELERAIRRHLFKQVLPSLKGRVERYLIVQGARGMCRVDCGTLGRAFPQAQSRDGGPRQRPSRSR